MYSSSWCRKVRRVQAEKTIVSLENQKQLGDKACDAAASQIQALQQQIETERILAASKEQNLLQSINERREAYLQIKQARNETMNKIASLQESLEARQLTVRDAKNALEARCAEMRQECSQLADKHARSALAAEEQITTLKADVEAAQSKLDKVQASVLSSAELRAEEIKAMNARIAAAVAALEAKKARLEDSKAENAKLTANNALLSEELVELKSRQAQSLLRQANDRAILALHLVEGIQGQVQHAQALEDRKSALAASLMTIRQRTEDVRESLDFSVVEHRLHMESCTKDQAASAARLASLQITIASLHPLRAQKEKEVAALRAQLAEETSEQEAELAGLNMRLKLVSEGYAETEKARKEKEKALGKAKWEHKQEKRRNKVAVAAYQRSRDLDNSYSESLSKTIDQQLARMSALDAGISELDRKTVDEAGLAAPTLLEKVSSLEDELADACQALSAKEMRATHLEETLLALKCAEKSLEAERCYDRGVFAEKLAKANAEHDELLARLEEQDVYHRNRMADATERLERARDALTNMHSAKEENLIVPEFVQGSSRESTPELDPDDSRQADSNPSTPALSSSPRMWSRSASKSPRTPAELLRRTPYVKSSLSNVLFIASLEDEDGGVLET